MSRRQGGFVASDQAGFTLIEMLVVMVIMAVVAAVGLPLVQGAPDRLRLADATSRLRDTLRLTRSMAIVSNDERVVTIDTGAGTVSFGDGNTQRLGVIHADLVIADVERRSDAIGGIRFFADGSSTGGRIRLRLKTMTNTILVDWLTGSTTIAKDADERLAQ